MPVINDRKIYTVAGVNPEILAYGMAKYSRSSASLADTIAELSAQKSEQFLDTYYFQYGHKSIADMAHIPLMFENISIAAAITIVDEQLWDGQERSTRYQDFSTPSYVLPPQLETIQEIEFHANAKILFATYAQLTAALEPLVRESERWRKPPEMDEKQYTRTIKARIFDIARYLLPLATKTSLGQITTARTLERQINRMLSDNLSETTVIAGEMQAAVRFKPPVTLEDKELSPLAPTLVKRINVDKIMNELLAYGRLYSESSYNIPESNESVRLLSENESYDFGITASIAFLSDAKQRSYSGWLNKLQNPDDVFPSLAVSIAGYLKDNPHTELPRVLQTGYPLVFDILVDIGAFRDLHRHRRCVQLYPPFTTLHGFVGGWKTIYDGFGEEIAYEADKAGICDLYNQAMQDAGKAAKDIHITLLPLGYKARLVMKMDIAEAVYITTLRTQPAGHFSYRNIAFQMAQAVKEKYYSLETLFNRVVNPHDVLVGLER